MQNLTLTIATSALIFVLTMHYVSGQSATQNEQVNVNGNNVTEEPRPRLRSMFRDMMSVNVPMFYDMVKDGSSMGINVLSGLVKVERGNEAERSGLQGRRPLSVKVFGIPVYERGTRVRNPESYPVDPKREPKVDGPLEDEELPIES